MTNTETKPAARNQSAAGPANPSKTPWYELAAEAGFSQLEATPAGLTSDEVRRRLAQYGYNELTAAKRFNWATHFGFWAHRNWLMNARSGCQRDDTQLMWHPIIREPQLLK